MFTDDVSTVDVCCQYIFGTTDQLVNRRYLPLVKQHVDQEHKVWYRQMCSFSTEALISGSLKNTRHDIHYLVTKYIDLPLNTFFVLN